jgi:hypothetical protein
MTTRISRRCRALGLVRPRATFGRARSGCPVAVIAAVLAFPGAASADVLSTGEAGKRIREHAQKTVDHPQTPFTFFSYSCSGSANHEKTCVVSYDTPQTRGAEVTAQEQWVCRRLPGSAVRPNCQAQRPKRIAPWACTERILAYYNPYLRTFPHPLPKPGEGLGDLGYVWLRYISGACGPLRYSTPRPT